VTTRVRALRHHADDERGAVVVIVAIVLVLLMAMTAFALDTGNGWQTRRHLIVATDAAALAAAATYAQNGDGCSGVPSTFVSANVAAASVTACDFVSVNPSSGYVTVQAKTNLHYTFAGIIGFDDRDVHSSTTAGFGVPLSVTGLRPLALCNASDAYKTWIASDMTTPFTVTITYAKASPGDCGANIPGNWGVLDFDGGANSNNDTKEWVLNGYSGLVDRDTDVPGDTGAFSNSLSSQLNTLKTNHTVFQLPVYDSGTGNGANALLHVMDFISVVLIDFKATGPEADRWLELQIVEHVAQGTCCSHGIDTGTRVVFICAVDPTFPASNCTDR
jgi:Flp pilus assembly protein TadG